MNKGIFIILASLTVIHAQKWSVDRAQEWYKQQGWLVGCNFIPSTAENTIEMWQDETFDPKTIDIELGYAEGIGFNIIRVFLHYLVWQQDPVGFKQRLDAFLNIAISHKIKTMFVLFDDCWAPEAHLGPQEPPIPSVHNSRWVQCPGAAEVTNVTIMPILQDYVTDLLQSFADDTRVIIWDLYNEPSLSGHGMETFPLLVYVYAWARKVNTSQPITTCIWSWEDDLADMILFQIHNSDILTFHNYGNLDSFKGDYKWILSIANGRPAICSEYMARTLNSTFITHLPYMKSINVGAINWGLVSGKTQTIWPWGTPPYTPAPKIWFHDVFHNDGTPFSDAEAQLIRNLTAKNEFFSFDDFYSFK